MGSSERSSSARASVGLASTAALGSAAGAAWGDAYLGRDTVTVAFFAACIGGIQI